MPTAKKAELRIHQSDVFDGIFCILIIRGQDGIRPDAETSQHQFAYDAACEAVSKRVEELCEIDGSGKHCAFRIRCDNLYGTSNEARAQIFSWLSSGRAYTRSNQNGYVYFDISMARAEKTLQRMVEATGFSREVFEELTKLFIDIYYP